MDDGVDEDQGVDGDSDAAQISEVPVGEVPVGDVAGAAQVESSPKTPDTTLPPQGVID